VITSEINGTAITGGGWTIAFTSSAPGDVDTAVPTAANFVNEDDKIEFINSGASDTTAAVLFFADIRVGG
jgi:alpha-D-ribose 1-methylphosphonate 5-phosphate C-P lyase